MTIELTEDYLKAIDGLGFVHGDLREALKVATAMESIVLMGILLRTAELIRDVRALAEAKSCG